MCGGKTAATAVNAMPRLTTGHIVEGAVGFDLALLPLANKPLYNKPCTMGEEGGGVGGRREDRQGHSFFFSLFFSGLLCRVKPQSHKTPMIQPISLQQHEIKQLFPLTPQDTAGGEGRGGAVPGSVRRYTLCFTAKRARSSSSCWYFSLRFSPLSLPLMHARSCLLYR
jgi:hypothetical protein